MQSYFEIEQECWMILFAYFKNCNAASVCMVCNVGVFKRSTCQILA